MGKEGGKEGGESERWRWSRRGRGRGREREKGSKERREKFNEERDGGEHSGKS